MVQAQEVKVKLDESTYGISAQKLKGIANDLISKHLSRRVLVLIAGLSF